MTRNQMVNYFGEQVRSIGEALAAANASGDKSAVLAAMAAIRSRVEFLRGYATALEHAGWLSKDDADSVFAVFEQTSK